MNYLVNTDEKSTSHSNKKMFFGDRLGYARYDNPKYPIFEKMEQEMTSRFWTPHEINMSEDKVQYEAMPEHEKFIFLTVLSRQVALDTIQQRGPIEILSEHASLHELESLFRTWSFFEQIHSKSYSHTIRNVLSKPDDFFDNLANDEYIKVCVEQATKFYNKLAGEPNEENLLLCLFSVNALEAIQFYTSFLCSFAFVQMEEQKLKKNSSIIQLIMRDEHIHKNISAKIIQCLLRDEPVYKEIFDKNLTRIQEIYKEVSDLEKDFAKHVFSKGAMIGLNENMVCDYIDYITGLTLKGLKVPAWEGLKKFKTNPVPFIDKIGEADSVQVAPQETEKLDYLIDVIRDDVASFEELSETVVYTRPNCPYCVELKQLLRQRDIDFKEKIVGVDIDIEGLQNKVGKPIKTVPQLFLDGIYIGGCDDFKKQFGITSGE